MKWGLTDKCQSSLPLIAGSPPALLQLHVAGKKYDPPKRGTIEDEEGGYPGFGICIVNDTRADRSEQS